MQVHDLQAYVLHLTHDILYVEADIFQLVIQIRVCDTGVLLEQAELFQDPHTAAEHRPGVAKIKTLANVVGIVCEARDLSRCRIYVGKDLRGVFANGIKVVECHHPGIILLQILKGGVNGRSCVAAVVTSAAVSAVVAHAAIEGFCLVTGSVKIPVSGRDIG